MPNTDDSSASGISHGFLQIAVPVMMAHSWQSEVRSMIRQHTDKRTRRFNGKTT
jgi:hypothetical protein